MKEVYLDNSATTVVCKESAEKVIKALTVYYGNPSSLHSKGVEAERQLTDSRITIAEKLSVDPNELYFTSGGTESNNLALFGSARAKRRTGNRIVTTSIEHSSIIESCMELEKLGFEVLFLKPDSTGIIPKERIAQAIDSNTILVSMMAINNELGSIQPVSYIKKVVEKKRSPALIHVDAVQAFGKIPVKASKMGADLISITAHKIHGPKGVGALYISKKARILPIHFGGEQEKKLRPGTEAVPLIAGFGAAVSALPNFEDEYNHIKGIRDYCIEKLHGVKSIEVNSPQDALPYILNFSVEGIRSETMLHHLASMGIYVSSGSACAKGKQSHVLKEIGLPDRRISSAIRVSFSRYNSNEDIDFLVNGIKLGIEKLVKS